MDDVPGWLLKVRAGEPFSMPDEEFLRDIFAAQDRAAGYPDAVRNGFQAMQDALRDMLGAVGRDVVVRPPLTIDVGFNVEIGDGSFLNTNTTLLDTYPIRIGRHVQIAPNCAFYPVGHPMRPIDRQVRDAAGNVIGHITSGAPIIVEDNVWIGGNVVVTQGVTIGAGAMIGAGSVVTRSIPPGVFAAGNPCRVIRQL